MTFERLVPHASSLARSSRAASSLVRSSITLLVLALVSCDGADGARGTVLVRTSGGVEAREGIAADRTIDGFAIAFDHAVLALDDFTVRTQLGDDARVMADPAIVELVPTSAETWRFEGVPAQRWDDVSYVTAPARADARRLGVDDAIADAMIANGWSSYYEGTLTAPDGAVFPFAFGFPVTARYLRCRSGTDGGFGIAVPENGTAEVEISWHLTHLFFDSYAEDSALRAEAMAASVSEGETVTLASLDAQPLASLRGLGGGPLRDDSGFPVLYIPPAEGAETLADFVLAARFGHFNGLEGFCTTELVR